MVTLQRIDQVKGLPEIGRRYLVTCARVTFPRWGGPVKWEYLPVMGPPHADPEIVPDLGEHWHYDLRFFSDTKIRKWFNRSPLDPFELAKAMGTVAYFDPANPAPILKALKLYRQTPIFPQVSWQRTVLEPMFSRVQLRPGCRTCPHRGVSLAGLPEDAEGCVVCPGHGLRWNLRTGRVVAR